MSLTKRVSGDYNLLSVNPTDNINVTTNKMTVNGDLLVLGTTSYIASTNTLIKDNFITLNQGETGSGIAVGQAGLEVDRGLATNTKLFYNETTQTWQGTDDGTTSYHLNPLLYPWYLVDDPNPHLGGNLIVNDFTITSDNNGDVVIDAHGNGLVKIDNVLSLEEQTSDPTATPFYNKVYAKPVGLGGTGVFVKNETITDELVSRQKAIAFAIIF